MQICDNWFRFLCKYVPPSIKEGTRRKVNWLIIINNYSPKWIFTETNSR
jgi:hypothetical protein